MLIEKGEEFTDSEEESEVKVQGQVEDTLVRTENDEPAKKKKKIYKKKDDIGDTLPSKVRHIRLKER